MSRQKTPQVSEQDAILQLAPCIHLMHWSSVCVRPRLFTRRMCWAGDSGHRSPLVGERVINMTVPACPSFVPKPYPVHPSESIIARRSNYLAKRQLDTRSTDATKASPSECVNSGICHCGEACTVACQTFSTTDPLPTVNDCNVLATVLRGLSTTIGRTFVQGTGFPNPIIVDFSTCRAALGNIRTDGQAVEYCWDGLADNVNSGVSGCIAPHISSGATCTGQSNTWEMAVSGLNRNG